MATKHTQLRDFIQEHAVKRGRFTLASGLTSDYFIDGKVPLSRPESLHLIATGILDELSDFKVDAIGGPEIGAIYIATAVSMSSRASGLPIPLFTVRKERKDHGSQKRVEGFVPPGGRIAVVDDVVTTGGSIVQAIEAMRAEGCSTVVALSVVDRCSGAAAAMEMLDIPYRPLLTIADLGLSNDHTKAESSPVGSA